MRVSLKQKSKSTSLAAAAALLSLLLAGCGSRPVVDTATTPPGPTGPWFCEPATDGAGWDCTDNPDRIANPRPSQPLARALAKRDAAEAAARRDAVGSVDALNDSLVTAGADGAAEAEIEAPTPGQTSSASAPATTAADIDPATTTVTPPQEPAYVRLAYRPERPVSLLDLPPDFYAVQVVALSSADELERFFDRLGVDDLTAAEVEVDGELRYVLLLGIYETFAAAEQAAADPPAALASYYPWVRRLEGLQAAMLRAEQRRLQARENS